MLTSTPARYDELAPLGLDTGHATREHLAHVSLLTHAHMS